MRKKTSQGMNTYQKAAHRPGEKRVSREDIEKLLELSCSDDPEERVTAATYLCPCHVRHRNEAVWAALYRMMEDSDVRVRRRAWHTLEDGGKPGDPAFVSVLERALAKEKDRVVLGYACMFSGMIKEREKVEMKRATLPEKNRRGVCDFCGAQNVFVRHDLDTTIPSDGAFRVACICEPCAKKLSPEHLF